MSNFSNAKHVEKTHGNRTCCWCGETIPSDSPAQRWAGRNNGAFWSGYMHTECDAAYRQTDNSDIQDGWEPGEFTRGMTPREARKQAGGA